MPTSSQIISAHKRSILTVRTNLENYAHLLWKAQPGFRDADVANFARRMVPVVQSAQVRTAALTSSYLAQLSTVKTGAKVAPVPVVRADVVDLRSVDPLEAYARPAVTVRTALSKGTPYSTAVDMGASRLVSLVVTDLQMSKVRQSDASMRRSNFQYYARVTGGKPCALCTIASTQRYRRGNLMPIHPGCNCDVEPLEPGSTSGQVINRDLLERTHAEIESKLGSTDRGARNLGIGKYDAKGNPISDFTDLIVTHEHGDIGPVLSWRGDHFSGPASI